MTHPHLGTHKSIFLCTTALQAHIARFATGHLYTLTASKLNLRPKTEVPATHVHHTTTHTHTHQHTQSSVAHLHCMVVPKCCGVATAPPGQVPKPVAKRMVPAPALVELCEQGHTHTHTCMRHSPAKHSITNMAETPPSPTCCTNHAM